MKNISSIYWHFFLFLFFSLLPSRIYLPDNHWGYEFSCKIKTNYIKSRRRRQLFNFESHLHISTNFNSLVSSSTMYKLIPGKFYNILIYSFIIPFTFYKPYHCMSNTCFRQICLWSRLVMQRERATCCNSNLVTLHTNKAKEKNNIAMFKIKNMIQNFFFIEH